MTRDEQLAYCRVCTNRKMDLQKGLICSLTDEKADFVDTCPSYNLDEEEKNKLDAAKNYVPAEEESEKKSIWTLIVGIILIVRGIMRIAQGELGIFGIIMLLIGVGSVVVYFMPSSGE